MTRSPAYLALPFFASACGGEASGPPPVPGSNSYRYSLSIPADFAKQEVQGIDSEVARYQGRGVVFSMDHGMYSGAPTCTDRHGRCDLRTVELDGRDALVGRYRNGPTPGEGRSSYFLHVHVPLKQQPTEEALNLMAHCGTEAACRRALEIFKTVRFTKR